MRFGAMLAVAAGAWLAAGAAQAQPTRYPASLEREPLLLWLQRETDIRPNQVVAVTRQALTSIISTFPASSGIGPRVVIRAEALSREAAARTGAVSWHVSMVADCETRRIQLGETTGYPERNLLGARASLRPAQLEWLPPEPGTAFDIALTAACEPGFRGPFSTPSVKLAAVDGAAPPPAPKPEPPPPKPAAKPAPTPKSEPPPTQSASAPPAPKAAPASVSQPVTPVRGASNLVAQVGAVGSDAEAKALLSKLGAGRETWVETATVAGKVWRRAVVGGFADGGEAQRFCAELTAAGKACFVRPGRRP